MNANGRVNIIQPDINKQFSMYDKIPVRNTFFCVTFLNFLLHRKTQKTKKKMTEK